MKLTLRTLLAYLDDTLDAEAAKELGHRVAETSVARDLIEKIRAAATSQRIGAPPEESAQAIVPSETVAAYLDNGLPPDGVRRVEEVALGSDLYLAEVVCCHQVLTLNVGEPYDVPAADRNYFKLLAETTADARLDLPREEQEAARAAVRSLSPRLRVAPLVAVGLLLAVVVVVLAATILRKTGPEPTGGPSATTPRHDAPATVPSPAPDAPTSPPDAPETEAPAKKSGEPPDEPQRKPAEAPGKTAPEAGTGAAAEAAAPEELKPKLPVPTPRPAPAWLARLESTDGILGKLSPDTGQWVRVSAVTDFQPGADIASIGGQTVKVTCSNGLDLQLREDARLQLLAAYDADRIGVQLDDGRVDMLGKRAGAVLHVRCLEQQVRIESLASGTVLALSRTYEWPEGLPLDAGVVAHRIAMVCRQGRVRVGLDGQTVELKAPATVTWRAGGPLGPAQPLDAAEARASESPAPAWQSAYVRLARAVPVNRSIGLALEEACAGRDPYVGQLAAGAIVRIGTVDRVVRLLDHDNQTVRQTIVAGLRGYFARDPRRWRPFWTALGERVGDDDVKRVEALVVGFTRARRSQADTYEALIADLRHPSRLIRELAVAHLEAMTGKTMNFVADGPLAVRQRAIARWQNALLRGELPPRVLR